MHAPASTEISLFGTEEDRKARALTHEENSQPHWLGLSYKAIKNYASKGPQNRAAFYIPLYDCTALLQHAETTFLQTHDGLHSHFWLCSFNKKTSSSLEIMNSRPFIHYFKTVHASFVVVLPLFSSC